MWEASEKKPIGSYLIITFAITYAVEFLVVLIERLAIFPEMVTKIIAMTLIACGAATAPGIAVYLLLKKHEKISGIKDYLKRVMACRSWKAFTIGTIIAFVLFGIVVVFTEQMNDGMALWMAPLMVIFMIPGGGWEELGWRGFLQPALEEKMGFLPATIAMGTIWSVWHLPLWLIQSANQKNFSFAAFAFYCIILSFLLAATYKMTGSVFATILVHAWGNTMCGGIFSYNVLVNGPSRKGLILMLAMALISIVLYYVSEKIFASEKKIEKEER